MRLSGLQLDVIKLYRNLLRCAKNKSNKFELRKLIRENFREKAQGIEKHDFHKIEHFLRYGYKQIKLINMPGFSSANFMLK